jgi:hypothetical protein
MINEYGIVDGMRSDRGKGSIWRKPATLQF